jgi:predicted enzyme related to lactoylglutathione lyase
MSSEQIQKSYEMPPHDGFTVTHFITVADIARSARFYEKVFGGRILSLGDSKGASGHIQIANTWLIVNVGGGPTPDKPTVTLSVTDPNHISSFMNFRVADMQACYALWKSRGAEFITEPIPKYGEIRCYIRDPDGYIIEVGQGTDLTYG